MSDLRIVVQPHIAWGQPHIAGKGVTTAVIRDRWLGGEPRRVLLRDYDLTNAELDEALAFERWCRRRGRYDAPYAERLARRKLKLGVLLGAGGWPRQVWPRRASAGDAGAPE